VTGNPGFATLDARGDEPVRYEERRFTSLNTSCRPTQDLLHDSCQKGERAITVSLVGRKGTVVAKRAYVAE